MKHILMTIIICGLIIITVGCSPKYACKQTVPGAKCASLSDIYEEEVLGIQIDGDENDDDSQDNEESGYEKRYYGTSRFPTMLVVTKKESGEVKKKAEQKKERKEESKTTAGIVRNIRDSEEKFPILRPPKIARIWIAPWIASSGDLNMGNFIYTEIEGKKWILGEESAAADTFGNVTKEYTNKGIDALK